MNVEEIKNENDNCYCKNRAPILIVDDNIFNILAIQNVLEDEDNDVILKSDIALNGELAIKTVEKRIQDI